MNFSKIDFNQIVNDPLYYFFGEDIDEEEFEIKLREENETEKENN